MKLNDLLLNSTKDRHFKAIFYGGAGCGKTYLSACSESPVFVRTEDRHRYLPIENAALMPLCTKYVGNDKDDLTSLLNQLRIIEKSDHEFKTLVIDGLSGVADIFKSHVLKTKLKNDGSQASSLEDYGFNLGYSYVIQLWSSFLSILDRIADIRGMNIILLSHSVTKLHKSPIAGEEYEVWGMSLFDQKNLSAEKLVQQWADFVFFIKMETLTTTQTTGSGRLKKTVTKAVDVNEGPSRCLFTQERSAFFAKNSKPDTIEFMHELDGVNSCREIFELMK